jgi:hypothetical protein
MSLCAEEQILLSHSAMMKFKERKKRNIHIPKNALSVFVGLYKFKGVSEPEQVYAMGLIEAQLQPPPDSEKAKRIGGKGKVRVRLRNKRIIEIAEYFFWRIGFIVMFAWLWILWPLLSDPYAKQSWNIDYLILRPFEWIDVIFDFVKHIIKITIEDLKK